MPSPLFLRCANILAPAMVPDRLCCRASALMALTFQVGAPADRRFGTALAAA